MLVISVSYHTRPNSLMWKGSRSSSTRNETALNVFHSVNGEFNAFASLSRSLEYFHESV